MHILSSVDQAIPNTMAEAFTQLERLKVLSPGIADKMRRSVGYRNIAVHNYDELTLTITYDIAHLHLDGFKIFIKEIMCFEHLN